MVLHSSRGLPTVQLREILERHVALEIRRPPPPLSMPPHRSGSTSFAAVPARSHQWINLCRLIGCAGRQTVGKTQLSPIAPAALRSRRLRKLLVARELLARLDVRV